MNPAEQTGVASFPGIARDVSPAALRVTEVSHAYGRREALKAVSLTVGRGSSTALIGVNGAGKTTLLNFVAGLFSGRSGTIEVCGHDVRSTARAALSRLGIVFQSRALDPSVLWATDLIEEILPDDPVYVLRRGEIPADGPAAEIAGGGTRSDGSLRLAGGRNDVATA